MRLTLFLIALLLVPTAAFAADHRYGTPIRHENLTIVPVYPGAEAAVPKGNYLTFSEASDRGLIEVTELNGSTDDAQVEAVHVTSKSAEPILLLAGEVILGGKQDRVISTNTIVEPGTKELRVSVFCVEQGRWDGRRADFQTSKKVAHGKLRTSAVFEESQQKVWEEVKKQNSKSKVKPSTGTYRATLDQKELNARVERAVAAVLPKLAADSRAIGVVAAIDGNIRSMDAFANAAFFAKMREQLVRSYVLTAVTSAEKKEVGVAAEEIDSLNARIADKKDAKERKKSSGEADTEYTEKPSTKRSVTRTKDGDKVHDYVSFD